MVLKPIDLHMGRSLRKQLKKTNYTVTINHRFSEVIKQCAITPREAVVNESDHEDDPTADTWITEDMQQAYEQLHHAGYAHSVELWQDNKLLAGLYGIALGKVFLENPCSHR